MVKKLLNMQYVKIDRVESTMETITVIPMLCINDLPNSPENLSFRIFADDTS